MEAARVAKIKAAEKAKEAKIKAEREACEAKIKAEKEAKEVKKAERPRKAIRTKTDTEISQGNVRLVAPVTVPYEEVRAFGRDLEKIEGVKILMLGHSEEEGHLILLALQKPMTLVQFIRDMPRVGNVEKKGGEISVDLRDRLS